MIVVAEPIKTSKLTREEIEKYTVSDPEDLLARVNRDLSGIVRSNANKRNNSTAMAHRSKRY